MDADERARLRELADKAIPGSWRTEYDEDMGEVSIRQDERANPPLGSYVEVATTAQWPDDADDSATAEFIAAARTALPALLDALDAAEQRLAAVQALADEWDSKAGPKSALENVFGKQCVSVEFAVEKIRAVLAGDLP